MQIARAEGFENNPTTACSRNFSFMGRKEYVVEITGLEPDRRIQFPTRTGPLKPTTHLFEPSAGGTRFTRHVDIPVQGAFRLMAP